MGKTCKVSLLFHAPQQLCKKGPNDSGIDRWHTQYYLKWQEYFHSKGKNNKKQTLAFCQIKRPHHRKRSFYFYRAPKSCGRNFEQYSLYTSHTPVVHKMHRFNISIPLKHRSTEKLFTRRLFSLENFVVSSCAYMTKTKGDKRII